jgi:heptosyltransferase-1
VSKNRFCFGVKSKLFAGFFDACHACLRVLFPSRFKENRPREIRRILLCNWGSLGDVVLATSVIPAIRAAFPGCKIGFLVSRGSKVVLETCEGIDWIHETSSWARVCTAALQKVRDFWLYRFGEAKRVVREIAEKNYDCAFELYPFFPNIIALLYKAKIPIRVGFNTSGNSLLLTRVVGWKEDVYLPLRYEDLLAQIGVKGKDLRPRICVKKQTVCEGPFVIFHLCSSFAGKEFALSFWKKLYEIFCAAGWKVVFTGRGEREKKAISQVCTEQANNFCDKLSWVQLVSLIQKSALVVSVDSVPIHLAAALGAAFIGLYKATPFPMVWQPNRENGAVFSEGVDPQEVFERAKGLMRTQLVFSQ